MKKKRTSLKRLPAWKALAEHSKEIRKLHLRELFANDSTRGEKLVARLRARTRSGMSTDELLALTHS